MPIFKVTATEDIKRTLVTYVVADDERAADQWASNASDKFWKCVWESPPWGAVSHIESVEDAPPGVIVRCATTA